MYKGIVAPSRSNGTNYYLPTVFELPSYATAEDNETAMQNAEIELEVVHMGGDFDLSVLRPATTDLFPQLPKELRTAIDLESLEKWFIDEYPSDGQEVHEWMAMAAAMQAVIDARTKEYNQNSWLAANAGDGFIPGVRLDGAWFESKCGSAFVRSGTNCHYPGNVLHFPPMYTSALISRDWLGFGATGRPFDWWIQYHAMLGHFFRLASKITRPVTMIRTWNGNAPFFTAMIPQKKTKRVQIYYQIYADRGGTATFLFRSPNDFTRALDLPGRVDLRRGRNDVYITIASYPYVPSAVHHIEFDVGTSPVAIRSYETKNLS